MQFKKLSDALRHGATLRPQAIRSSTALLPDGTVAACAMVSIWEATTGQTPTPGNTYLNDVLPVLEPIYPQLREQIDFTLDEEDRPNPLAIGSAIVQLQDAFDWSREQIADWLAERGY